MKKKYLPLLVLFVVFNNLQAQDSLSVKKLQIGVTAGALYTFVQVKDESMFNPESVFSINRKFGYSFGGDIHYKISKRTGLGTGLILSYNIFEVYQDLNTADFSGYSSNTVTIEGLELPVYASYVIPLKKTKTEIKLIGGVNLGRQAISSIRSKGSLEGNPGQIGYRQKDNLSNAEKTHSLGLLAGIFLNSRIGKLGYLNYGFSFNYAMGKYPDYKIEFIVDDQKFDNNDPNSNETYMLHHQAEIKTKLPYLKCSIVYYFINLNH